MMKNRRSILLVCLVIAAVLLFGTVTALAARNVIPPKGEAPAPAAETVQPDSDSEGAQEEIPTADTALPLAQFGTFTGVIQEIRPFYANDGKTPIQGRHFALVKDDTGSLMTFVVSEDTYCFNGRDMVVGDTFTGYYDATKPAIAIYPPQHAAVVAVIGKLADGQSLEVDLFDEYLVDVENDLKLNISDDTEIITPDGRPYDRELANRRLAVVYAQVTLSIPGQTTPVKIVVLDEEAVTPPAPIDAISEIIVEGKKIKAQAAYYNRDGIVMVPLKPVAEALGFNTTYDEITKTMTLGNAHTATVGEDSYIVGRMAPISLGTAPVLKNGEVFVPMSYFTKVLNMNNAYVLEGQLVIDNQEAMR